jgi:ELWxxDGT repeat protein
VFAKRKDRRPRGQRACAFESLEGRALLSAELVSDINPNPGSSSPTGAVHGNGITYFVADDNLHGPEVWRTDGTPEGTFMLRDFVPGPGGSNPLLLGTAGEWTYVRISGSEIWQTNGTADQTFKLNLGSPSTPVPSTRDNSVVMGGELYFMSNGTLYKARGTVRIVSPVKQISSSNVDRIVATTDRVYVSLSSGALWVSDGTSNGTTELRPSDGSSSVYSKELAAIGKDLYFVGRDPAQGGYDLWRTQGTAQTTVRVKDLPATLGGPRSMVTGGQTFYFVLNQNYPWGELWRSDGTAEGTLLLKTQTNFNPQNLVTAGGRLFFTNRDFGPELWTSDGTPAGTVSVNPGTKLATGTSFVAFNDKVLFRFSDAESGSELWISDGTPGGTARVADAVPGPGGSGATPLVWAGSYALFSAADPARGREPWVTDGTSYGTRPLKDVNAGTEHTFPSAFTGVGEKLFFTAHLPPGARKLWVLPSPSASPVLLSLGAGDAPENLTAMGGKLYFTALVGGYTTLCVSDGTPEGTMPLKQITDASNPSSFMAVGDRLFFKGTNYTPGDLWTSDGTPEGTFSLGNLRYAGVSPAPRNFTSFNGALYFGGGDAATGVELWRSDGTPGGTGAVADLTPGAGSTEPSLFTRVGDWLYFVSGDMRKIYRTDGSWVDAPLAWEVGVLDMAELGGALVFSDYSNRVWRLDPAGGAPVLLGDVAGRERFTRAGRWLYFTGTANTVGRELWRTDGTPAGTARVADVLPGAYGSDPQEITAAGRLVYFHADDGVHGRELWVSDGTAAGTSLVADLIPGKDSSLPTALASHGGAVYFAGHDGVHGREPWRAVDDTAPAVTNAAFDYDGRPAAVRLSFGEWVGPSLTLSDFGLTNRASGEDVSSLLAALDYDDAANVATIRLADPLPDGDYRLTAPAGAVADASGNLMQAAFTFDFFQLGGDINRDREVNFTDLVALAQNYDRTDTDWASGDLTGDGKTDFADLVVIAQRYGTVLAQPVAIGSHSPTPAGAAGVLDAAPSKQPTFRAVPPARRAATTRLTVRPRR